MGGEVEGAEDAWLPVHEEMIMTKYSYRHVTTRASYLDGYHSFLLSSKFNLDLYCSSTLVP